MRKISALAAALVLPAVPILVAAPAHAAGTVICVNYPITAGCSSIKATIPLALTAAAGDGVDTTILVGPGTYSDGPYQVQDTADTVTLQGSGTSTVITLPAGGIQTYLTVSGSTVRNLKVKMSATTPDNDTAINAYGGATVSDVTVDGAGIDNALGLHVGNAHVSNATISMPGNAQAAYGEGSSTITDSTLTAGYRGFYHSGSGAPDVLSRVTIRTSLTGGVGVNTDGGVVNVDNSVIDLGTAQGAVGLAASNFNNGTTPLGINADHVTIVGGGANSRGAWAYAATAGAKQSSTVTVANSIIRGPATSLAADAGNNGAQGGASTAQLTADHTDYQTKGGTIGANGTGGVALGAGNLVDVDPLFASGTDYHLALGSPAIDAGNPVAGSAMTDRDGHPRVLDGNSDGVKIRDLGAYEYVDVIAPQTTLTAGPAARTRDTTPTFSFTSEIGATFACRVDAGAWKACASPFTTPALGNGPHSVQVRAADTTGNPDLTPSVRTFTVDTQAPNTGLTKKPAKTVSAKKVTFTMSSTESGAKFQCRLDSKPWKACGATRAFSVAKGSHTFYARATDLAGNTDKTPARYRFKRV